MASYKVKPGNIFGRVGEGFGQGLAQQIPKEIERHRLQSGLTNLAQESEGLSPFQQFARLSSIPGATPQMISSGTDLLRQQAKGNALANLQNNPTPGTPFPELKVPPDASPTPKNAPSITKEGPLAELQKGYRTPTQEEIYAEGGRMYNANPALFGNDPQKAIQAAEDKSLREEKRFGEIERQHERLTAIQDNVSKRLKAQSEALGTQVPPDVYSKIDNEAIQATKSKEDGGRGLTEQQAMKEYGEKLDNISREYQDLNSVGGLGMLGKPAKNTLTTLNQLQKSFAKRGDTRSFADQLVAGNNISYPLAYSIAEPVSGIPKLAQEIRNLPRIQPIGTPQGPSGAEKSSITEKIVKKLAENMGDASPMAIAYELNKKGYDPQVFLEYIRKNKNDELTGRQIEQANKSMPTLGSLSDWWLSDWTGIGD